MNVELPQTLVIVESIVYKSNGFAIKKSSFGAVMNPRLGLQTIRRRKLTLSGVKPVGKHQWK